MIGFDTASYSGTSGKGSIPLAVISLGSMLMISVLVIANAKMPGEAKRKHKKGNISRRPAQRERLQTTKG